MVQDATRFGQQQYFEWMNEIAKFTVVSFSDFQVGETMRLFLSFCLCLFLAFSPG